MADDPSTGELSRRIDGLIPMLAQLVQRTEFTAEQRIVDRRFTDVEGDVGELRRSLLEEIKGLRADLLAAVAKLEAADEKREDKRGTNVRQLVYAGIVPAVLLLATLSLQIWSTLRGT